MAMKMNDSGQNCILSVDAGGTFLKAVLFYSDSSTLNTTIINNTFFKIPVDSEGSLDSIKNSYIQVASLGAQEASKRGLKLSGIGVCIPGPFDYSEGICMMKHKYSSIYGAPMRPWFEEGAAKVPISFVHDSTAFILGAASKERYKSFNRIGAVIIGTGLGFATMINSKVFNNPQGGPGISIYSRTYRKSTAEEYVSRRAIISHFKKLCPNSSDDIDVLDIVTLARSGNTTAIKVFNDTGMYLSEIIHDIMYDNKFDCLLLGGAISKSADLFITTLKEGLSDIPTLTMIEPVEDIDNAPLIGAARAVL
jgi:glucokinase